VRQPILTTGMGKVVPIGDSGALANAIQAILAEPDQYQKDPRAIAQRFTPDAIASLYEEMFEDMLAKK